MNGKDGRFFTNPLKTVIKNARLAIRDKGKVVRLSAARDKRLNVNVIERTRN